MYTYKATVDRIVDGDTVVLTVDVGFRLKTTQSFRLNRIDTPELRVKEQKKDAQKAKIRLSELIEGKDIIIKTEKAGKFGRWLVEIEYEGKNINDLLVKEGHAVYKEY